MTHEQHRIESASSPDGMPNNLSSSATPAEAVGKVRTEPGLWKRVSHWSRVLLSGVSFAFFFIGSPVLGLLLFPATRIFSKTKDRYRERCTEWLARGYRFFFWWCDVAGLFRAGALEVPPLLASGKPYVLIANHPTLVDVILLISRFPRLTCVVKGDWFGSFAFGSILRSTTYIPARTDADSESALPRYVRHLERYPLLVFPEGTRSLPNKLHRFRLGAFEAAVQAGVPIAAVFLEMDRVMLQKGQPWWSVPDGCGTCALSWIGVVDTQHDKDAKAIRARLEALYKAKYADVVARRQGKPAMSDRNHNT